MDAEAIKSIGENIVMPICFFAFMAYLIYSSNK